MQSLISASIINTAAGLGSLLAGFASTVLIARMLGAEGTGQIAFAMWLVFSAAVIADRGTPAMLIRYIARLQGSERIGPLTRALYLRFLWPAVGLLLCFLGYAAWTLALDPVSRPMLWAVTGITFVAYAHGAVAIAAAQGLSRFSEAARRTALGALLQVPAIVIGAYFFGAAGAMLGYLARHLPQGLGWFKYWSPGKTDPDTVTAKMASYGRNAWVSGMFNILVRTRIEFLFIGWFFSITEVGYFAIGMTFVSMVYQLTLFMLAGLTPKFSQLHDTDRNAQFSVTYQRVLRWMSIILLPISFGGAVIMPTLIPVLFGNEFVPAVSVSIVLVVFMFAQALATVPLAAMLAREKDQIHLLASAVIGGLLIVLNLAFTPMFGSEAAAWIKGLVNTAALGALFWYLHLYLDLPADLWGLTRIILAAGMCAAAAFGLLQFVDGIPGLVVAIMAGALVYLAALRLLRAIPADDVDSLSTSLRHILPRRLAGLAILIARWLQAPQPTN